jgi:predicted ATPase
MQKLPSFRDGVLKFECKINRYGVVKYDDGFKRNNAYIKEVFPKIYHIDHHRNFESITNDILALYDSQALTDLRENVCMFDKARKCHKCFNCIGLINKKEPKELTTFEAARLLEYKLINVNLKEFQGRVNKYFAINGSRSQEILFDMKFNVEGIFSIAADVYDKDRRTMGSVHDLSEGIKSIFVMSLLEAYIEEDGTVPSIIMIEDPEIFLHPQLQKSISETLFRLSKKNQVVFTTHSPNLITNFSSKQIKQVVLDDDFNTTINENDQILTLSTCYNSNDKFVIHAKLIKRESR